MPALAEFLKTWWGAERRSPMIFALKLLGFAISFTAGIVILAFIRFETGYDAWNGNASRIARAVETRDAASGAQSVALPYPFADAVASGLAGVEDVARVQPLRVMLQRDQDRFNERVFFVEPAFLRLFEVKLVSGAAAPLEGASGLVLSRSAARKYFGERDAIGQRLRLGGVREVTVTGVMEDWPADSHVRPDYLLPLEAFFRIAAENGNVQRERITGWRDCHCYATYVLFETPEAMALAQRELHGLLVAQQGEDYARANAVTLQPLTRAYLHSAGYATYLDHAANGDPVQLAILGSAALVLLLVAVLNFVNFSFAQVSLRAREFAVRRTLGARPGQLVARVTAETALSALAMAAVATIVAALLLRPLSVFMERPVSASRLLDPAALFAILAIAVAVGMASGSIPVMLLARASPARLLRGAADALGGSRTRLRLVLVGAQFLISTVLLSFAIAMYSELAYVQSVPRNFDAARKLIVNGEGSHEVFGRLMAEFAAVPGVAGVAVANAVPTTPLTNRQLVLRARGDDAEGRQMMLNDVDFDWFDVLGVDVVAGRTFDRSFGGDGYLAQWDTAQAAERAAAPDGSAPRVVNVVVNERASRALGFGSPREALDERLRFLTNGAARYEMRIVGVVADLRYGGPRDEIEPLIYRARDDWQLNVNERRYFVVALDERANEGEVRRPLARLWNEAAPSFVEDVGDLAERLAALGAGERRQLQLILLFMGAAVALALLGTLGFSTFLLQRDTKSLAIRRVLGATHRELSARMAARLTAALALASVAAWPAAYLLIEEWLEGFVLRVPISASWFLAATVAISGLALVVSFIFISRLSAVSPAGFLRRE